MPYHWLWTVIHDSVVYCIRLYTVDGINNKWNKYILLIVRMCCYTYITTVPANKAVKAFLIIVPKPWIANIRFCEMLGIVTIERLILL